MTRFFLDDLVQAGLMTERGDLSNVPDVYQQAHVVSGRAKAAIREFLLRLPQRFLTQGSTTLKMLPDKGIGIPGSQVYERTKGSTACYTN